LRKRLRLDQLKPGQLALGLGGLFLLSVAVTLIVLLAAPRGRPRLEAGKPLEAEAPEPLGVQDFLLENPEPPALPRVFLYREPTPRWSEEQVRRYWVPVDKAVMDILKRENDSRMEQLFREVP